MFDILNLDLREVMGCQWAGYLLSNMFVDYAVSLGVQAVGTGV